MKYSVMTFGCRVNQADSLGFEEELAAAGGRPAACEEADLVIVNTCSVTASADQGARQTIRRVARINPAARIVVTGCYATRQPDDLRSLPNVSCVVPNNHKPQLVSIVRGIRPGSILRGIRLQPLDFARDRPDVETTTAERFGVGEDSCGATIAPGVSGRTAFTLRVQTGCDEPCSYCIIPSTRGEPRSVPIPDVLAEVNRIVAAGFKEIVLTGVHLGSYGRDLRSRCSLVDLLRRLSTVPTSQILFRISSLEPMDCTREVVDLIAGSPNFAPHFHLPLQHASNRVLAAMRRPYTIDEYATLVDDIRRRIPHAAIGSDIIVGFPGEADEDFDVLADYLEHSPLSHLHVFPYSDRPGTAATALSGKVPGLVVRERARRIRESSARLNARFRQLQIGSVHQALTIDDGSIVVTGNYLKAKIPAGRERNEWVRVRITSTGDPATAELLGDVERERGAQSRTASC